MMSGKQPKIIDLESENIHRGAEKKGKAKKAKNTLDMDDLVVLEDERPRRRVDKGKKPLQMDERSMSAKPTGKGKRKASVSITQVEKKPSLENNSPVIIDDTPTKPTAVDTGTPRKPVILDIPDTPSDIQVISSTRPSNPPIAFADDEELARRLQNEEYEAYQPPSYLSILQNDFEIDDYHNFMADIPTNNYIPDEQFDDSYETLLQLGDAIGTVNTGLPKSIYSTYPTIKYKNEKLEQCVVCMTDYEKRENVMGLPCLHWFHKQCILSWFEHSSKCPV
ncbi:hypothetical protein HDV01_006629 [Terramyces sp. JEL0728]|nr:hypothetical protein HDV01_006629 [Terramyces sp. JEL0728]